MGVLRRLLVAVLLACSGVVLTQLPAHACKCADPDLRSSAERADVVFTGVLVAQEDSRRRTTYTFDLERIYAGELAGSPVEVVSTNTSCGLGRLRADRGYVVFAREQGAALRSDLCAGTARAQPAFVDRVERVLGPGTTFPPPPREEERPRAEFTRVDDHEPAGFTRLAAPGAALVLVGVLGLFVFRRRRS